jgi:class 3 adenylate cyclase
VQAAQAVAAAVRERYGGDVSIGAGISSGPVVVGSVGGGGRLEFAVIGDPVNVAARVEAITRETGDVILFTEATRCLLSEKESGVEARGEAQLRGIAEPVALYSPASDLDERSTLSKKTLITDA